MNLNAGLDTVTYVMTTEENHPKNINDYKVEEIKEDLKQILSMGSEIGIHPGILTFDDKQKMNQQKKALEEVINREVVRSRQHYLKYKMPITFRNLAEIGIHNDSSILVEGQENARFDTYDMIDTESKKPLNISQTPLVFMDTYHILEKDDVILEKLEKSLAPAKQHGGEVMILWHNINVSCDHEKSLYQEVLEVIKV